MMHNKNVIEPKDSLPVFIERKAIDASGRLGSLYDIYSDCIVGKLNVSDTGQSSQPDEPVRCEIIHGNTDKSQNLLQIIGIQDDLRLNILLNLVPRTRIASIINHPYPINEYTRFIYFSYENRKEQLPEGEKGVRTLIKAWSPKTTATHIITSVSWGIEVVVALQLPYDLVIIQQIDDVVGKIRDILTGHLEISSLNLENEKLLRQYTGITIYTNISYLNGMNSIRDICQFIDNRNENYKMFRPLTYTLNPIQLFYPQYTRSDSPFIQLESTYNNKLERYLLQYLNILKSLKHSLDYKVTRLLRGHLEEQLRELQQQWINLKSVHESDIKRLKNLVSDIRRGRYDISVIDEVLSDKEQTTFNDSFRKITQDLNNLEAKGQLITDLTKQQFQYCNVVERDIDRTDNETTIEHKLILDDQYDRVLCSNDALNKNKPEQSDKLRDDLIKEHKNHSKLRLTYADFSYCSFQLTNMMVLPLSTHKKKEDKLKQKDTSSSTEIPMPLSNINIINILLLGETGVGKSAFINALANYLTFNTLQQAHSNEPVVLIPVSFLITIGHNFEECIVKFGDVDSLNNEDFDHPGQSVTQYCKSYVFDLHHPDGQKIRIIDTPGFGDTRGLNQDDLNMQHILEYINNLSHLNAVCFLLKPNASRMNIFFRSCFTQLFNLLGENARNNIIFCFTNARSTFYTPGDTAPLLKKMLASLSIHDVPFKKENTFCFDSESFRYLVALKNNFQFTEQEKKEYEMSWSTSVIQSNRLIDYIHKQLTAYYIDGKLQSIKHAQLEIIHMIRPMLEAMRNILRNLIIYTTNSFNESFEMHPKAISRPATICNLCIPYPLQVGNFWIAHNIPHKIRNNCYSCSCSLDQHIPIDYVVKYEFLNNSSKYNHTQMSDLLDRLCQASVDLAYFLLHVARSSKNDPFFIGLVQMITEEKYLCDNQNPNAFNLRLVDDLRELQKEYDKKMSFTVHNQVRSKLSNIYRLINTVREYPMVREQIAAVKQGQKIMMKQYEYEVPQTRRNALNTISSVF